MTDQTENTGQQPQAQGPQFALQRIYVKDLSFETPNSPLIFLEQWNPQMSLNMNLKAQDLGEDHHEVILSLTVTVKVGEKTAFLAEVNQAGVFVIKDASKEQKTALLNIACPNLLFPYAREVVSDLATRGSFPQLLLQPINFEVIYAQKLKQESQAAAEETAGEPSH